MDQLASKTLADIYIKQGHYQQAHDILKSLAESDPSNREIQTKLEEVKEKLRLSFSQGRKPAPSVEAKVQNLEKWLSNIRKVERLRGDPIHQSRLESARKLFDSQAIEGMLFTGLENIRYLCGFTGSDGALLLTPNDCFFLTDSRYWTQSEDEVKGAKIVRYKKKIEGIASLVSDLKIQNIGFESATLTISSHRSLNEKLTKGLNFIPIENEIKNLRAVKDSKEIDLMRKALDISSRAFQHALGMAKAGSLEKDLALEMEFFMKRNGAELLGFDIIIASGKRSALPHGKASEKPIEKGDLILFDYGSRFQGYHSDETCTVICGAPSPEQEKIYRIVREAHDKAIELVRPGVPIREIDEAARNYIRERGYGDYFGHGLGHGVGLAVHEDPFVNGDNNDVAQEGMVFTIEPGIYLPDVGGVRLEDMILVTSQGPEVLTYLSKDLKVI